MITNRQNLPTQVKPNTWENVNNKIESKKKRMGIDHPIAAQDIFCPIPICESPPDNILLLSLVKGLSENNFNWKIFLFREGEELQQWYLEHPTIPKDKTISVNQWRATEIWRQVFENFQNYCEMKWENMLELSQLDIEWLSWFEKEGRNEKICNKAFNELENKYKKGSVWEIIASRLIFDITLRIKRKEKLADRQFSTEEWSELFQANKKWVLLEMIDMLFWMQSWVLEKMGENNFIPRDILPTVMFFYKNNHYKAQEFVMHRVADILGHKRVKCDAKNNVIYDNQDIQCVENACWLDHFQFEVAPVDNFESKKRSRSSGEDQTLANKHRYVQSEPIAIQPKVESPRGSSSSGSSGSTPPENRVAMPAKDFMNVLLPQAVKGIGPNPGEIAKLLVALKPKVNQPVFSEKTQPNPSDRNIAYHTDIRQSGRAFLNSSVGVKKSDDVESMNEEEIRALSFAEGDVGNAVERKKVRGFLNLNSNNSNNVNNQNENHMDEDLGGWRKTSSGCVSTVGLKGCGLFSVSPCSPPRSTENSYSSTPTPSPDGTPPNSPSKTAKLIKSQGEKCRKSLSFTDEMNVGNNIIVEEASDSEDSLEMKLT